MFSTLYFFSYRRDKVRSSHEAFEKVSCLLMTCARISVGFSSQKKF